MFLNASLDVISAGLDVSRPCPCHRRTDIFTISVSAATNLHYTSQLHNLSFDVHRQTDNKLDVILTGLYADWLARHRTIFVRQSATTLQTRMLQSIALRASTIKGRARVSLGECLRN